MRAAAPSELPPAIAAIAAGHETPPQNLREYDPEWGRAFWAGTVAESCDHARMLAAVKVPVLLTHLRRVDPDTGHLLGALSDLGAGNVRALVEGAGQPFDHRSFPATGHSMHGQDPQLFVETLVDWWTSLDAGR
jgi:pimeloyl-ACP methyl ester carboxylesterase